MRLLFLLTAYAGEYSYFRELRSQPASSEHATHSRSIAIAALSTIDWANLARRIADIDPLFGAGNPHGVPLRTRVSWWLSQLLGAKTVSR